MADNGNGNGFFKRAAEWLVLAGILTGWGITLGVWSNRLSNVELAVVKTTAEVEILKTNQTTIIAEIPHIKTGIDVIQKAVEKLDAKFERHTDQK